MTTARCTGTNHALVHERKRGNGGVGNREFRRVQDGHGQRRTRHGGVVERCGGDGFEGVSPREPRRPNRYRGRLQQVTHPNMRTQPPGTTSTLTQVGATPPTLAEISRKAHSRCIAAAALMGPTRFQSNHSDSSAWPASAVDIADDARLCDGPAEPLPAPTEPPLAVVPPRPRVVPRERTEAGREAPRDRRLLVEPPMPLSTSNTPAASPLVPVATALPSDAAAGPMPSSLVAGPSQKPRVPVRKEFRTTYGRRSCTRVRNLTVVVNSMYWRVRSGSSMLGQYCYPPRHRLQHVEQATNETHRHRHRHARSHARSHAHTQTHLLVLEVWWEHVLHDQVSLPLCPRAVRDNGRRIVGPTHEEQLHARLSRASHEFKPISTCHCTDNTDSAPTVGASVESRELSVSTPGSSQKYLQHQGHETPQAPRTQYPAHLTANSAHTTMGGSIRRRLCREWRVGSAGALWASVVPPMLSYGSPVADRGR